MVIESPRELHQCLDRSTKRVYRLLAKLDRINIAHIFDRENSTIVI